MIQPGTKLAHYEILEAIGKGGMGEVWCAKDTKLGRDVAIKTLPAEFAEDPDRLARFEREAKLLASLNHPNIAAIYGLEEHNGTRFLVLELVEGPTLEDRIKQGAIPVEESLKLALQIVEALEAAHERGVIHRDLKPANVKLTNDGNVKVLDFGLAKAFEGDQADVSVSNSPTLSMAATQAGVILGTAAYMSPEQAKGRQVDERTDVWAFGCVLYEMLTGRTVFEGEDAADILGAVLAKPINWDPLPPNLHPRFRELLERCLERQRKNRYRGINDARVEIEKVLADPDGVVVRPGAATVQAAPQSKLQWEAAIVLAAVVGAAVWFLKPVPIEVRDIGRFEHLLPEGQGFTRTGRPVVAVSPDGTQIAYVANTRLYLRTLSETDARPIPGTDEDPTTPFFSPDGEWIGFYSTADSQLKKIPIAGGTPVLIADATSPFGASWGVDDMIVYGQPEGILRVSGNGGTPETLVETESSQQVHGPQILPDGQTLLYSLTSVGGATRWDEAEIVVQEIGSQDRQTVWTGGSDARYVPTGHLVYALEDTLFGLPFDPDSRTTTGGPVPLVEGVRRAVDPHITTASGNFAFSDNGSLVYIPGEGIGSAQRALVAVDRNGNATPLTDQLRDYEGPKVSPDGTRVAVDVLGHVSILDIETQNANQLTFAGTNGFPVWTPDSQFIVFLSDRTGSFALHRQSADGTGEAELVFEGSRSLLTLTDISPTGILAFHEITDSGRDIWTLDLNTLEATEFLATPANERGAIFSPDGDWLAYISDDSGQDEIYTRPYPPTGNELRLISGDGAQAPAIWSPDGTEIYYRDRNNFFVSVPIQTSPNVVPGRPTELFSSATFGYNPNFPNYDVHPDDGRFVMVTLAAATTDGTATQQINIVLNFFEELKERVPVP